MQINAARNRFSPHEPCHTLVSFFAAGALLSVASDMEDGVVREVGLLVGVDFGVLRRGAGMGASFFSPSSASGWGTLTPIEDSMLDAGPASPCCAPIDSSMFLTVLTSILTGMKSSSSSSMFGFLAAAFFGFKINTEMLN